MSDGPEEGDEDWLNDKWGSIRFAPVEKDADGLPMGQSIAAADMDGDKSEFMLESDDIHLSRCYTHHDRLRPRLRPSIILHRNFECWPWEG